MFLKFIFLPVIEPPGLCLKPCIDLFLGTKLLVDVTCFIDQVEHHFVIYSFAELVGVDVAAKNFQAGLPIFLEQRRASEADKDSVRHNRLHSPVQFATLY